MVCNCSRKRVAVGGDFHTWPQGEFCETRLVQFAGSRNRLRHVGPRMPIFVSSFLMTHLVASAMSSRRRPLVAGPSCR